MAVTPITGAPLTITHPYIRIGDATTGHDIACAATHVTLEPDQDDNTVETFCAVYKTYGAEEWTLTATIAMSYGATAFWNTMRPLCNTVVPFAVRPDDGVVGPGNPEVSGSGYLKGFPFINAGPGEVSEVDIEIGVFGGLSQDTGSGPVPMFEEHTHGDTEPATEPAAA